MAYRYLVIRRITVRPAYLCFQSHTNSMSSADHYIALARITIPGTKLAPFIYFCNEICFEITMMMKRMRMKDTKKIGVGM
jgi:hypothetical protein